MTYTRPKYLVETNWLAEHLEDPELRIYDCTMHLIPHPEKVFTVENRRADFETGHIPGAGYLDLQEDLLSEDNTFLDPQSLRMKSIDAGISLDKKIVTYCGGGIAATVDSFALALLGHDHVGVYDNSLSEWANDPGLPMETAS